MKKIIKSLIIKNYIKLDSNKLKKLRKSILSTNNIFKKVIKIRKYNKILYKNNASIPLKTKIGENLTLPHGLSGIFISIGAEIGDNCTIFQQVTIRKQYFS